MAIESLWRNFDSTTKNIDWFRRILVDIQTKKQFLTSKAQYDLNESFSNGTYSTEFSRKKYSTFNVPIEDLGIDFQPLDLFGNRVNAITSIMEKMGMTAIANCTDPNARSKRDADIDLLKAEKE